MNLIKKLAKAKFDVASMEVKKDWKNTFSNYNYFTPEQVNKIVETVCMKNELFTKFDLKRNEFWIYWTLTIYDLEWEESIVFEWATAIPEIKATNVAQQIWGCMTYTERYLKMTAFWIVDNSLDFDTTENTKKNVEKKDITKEWPFQDLPRFNKEELETLKNSKDYLAKFQDSNSLIENISTKYRISKTMKVEIADVWAAN